MKVCLISCICLFASLQTLGQSEPPKFKQISLENGLSQSSITCIVKDSKGFMWFGTEDGLNKYDGTNFTIYRHIPNDDNSLSSSYITAIAEQKDGFLWIGTNNGLNYFDPNNEKFTRYFLDSTSNQIQGHNQINTLLLSKNENLLIGTGNGLYSYHPNVGFSNYSKVNVNDPYNIVSLVQDSEGYVWVLTSDLLEKVELKNGNISNISIHQLLKNSTKHTLFLDSLNLWIGARNGLIKLNLHNQTSNIYKFYDSKESPGTNDKIHSIIRGQKGNLLLGSSGGGLIDFDKLTGNFQTILSDPNSRSSLSSNIVSCLFLDESGILWIGTLGGGINKYDPGQFKFEHYKNHPGEDNSLSDNRVRSLLLDSDGELWVGTHRGLNRINRETGQINVYKHDPYNHSTISSDIVRALREDAQGTIWAGTWYDGLNSFDKNSGKFKRYIYLPGTTDSIGQVRALETDGKGNIWIGSKGLWKLNTITKQYKSYRHDMTNKNSLSTNAINSLYFDKTGLLWIGTQNGLNSLDTISNNIKRYISNPEDTLSLSHKYVTSTSMADGEKGTLWVGTYGGGLSKLNVSKGTFQHYNTSNGLLNDVIYGILIDNKGFVWFTSNAGLGRFDPNREEFKYFGINHGIQSDEFNAGAYFKSKEGEFVFGGINGFNSFFPNKINNKKETSRIVFTNFQLLDDNETPAKKVLDKHISRTEHIELLHDQNTFAIEFAELNYSENADNNYEYLLEGFEKNWYDLGKKHLITLGNINPGDYSLKVRVRNDLTKNTSIDITILHSFWQTNWAYAGYTLLVIILSTLIFRNIERTKRIRKQFEVKLHNWEGEILTTQLQNSHTIDNILSLNQVETKSRNEKFLVRVIEIVEEHLEDSDFDVEKFAGEMFMSRSQLHRKLKAITGYSTTEFIRFIRLKRAAQLLEANSGTVTEIAYKVGFDNIGYFSKCFKEVFGIPPSQFNGRT